MHLPTKRVYDMLLSLSINDIVGVAWSKHANIPPTNIRPLQSQQLEQLQGIVGVLEEWLLEFDTQQPFSTRISYLADIVSTCFELHIDASSKDAAQALDGGDSSDAASSREDSIMNNEYDVEYDENGVARYKGSKNWNLFAPWWTEDEALAFIEHYHEFLDFARASYACNQHGYERCLQLLHSLEDKYIANCSADDDHAASSSSSNSARTHRHPNWRLMDKRRDLIVSLDGIINNLPSAQDSAAHRLAIESILEKLRDRNDVSITLRYLERLLAQAPLATTKFCLLHFPSILPHNILGTANDTTTSRHAYAAKVYYLSNLMRHHTFYHSSMDLVHRWFELLLLVDPPPRRMLYMANSTTPRRNAHLLLWTHRDGLMGIIENVCSKKRYKESAHRLVSLTLSLSLSL
jgi:hypothetical protein